MDNADPREPVVEPPGPWCPTCRQVVEKVPRASFGNGSMGFWFEFAEHSTDDGWCERSGHKVLDGDQGYRLNDGRVVPLWEFALNLWRTAHDRSHCRSRAVLRVLLRPGLGEVLALLRQA